MTQNTAGPRYSGSGTARNLNEQLMRDLAKGQSLQITYQLAIIYNYFAWSEQNYDVILFAAPGDKIDALVSSLLDPS